MAEARPVLSLVLAGDRIAFSPVSGGRYELTLPVAFDRMLEAVIPEMGRLQDGTYRRKVSLFRSRQSRGVGSVLIVKIAHVEPVSPVPLYRRRNRRFRVVLLPQVVSRSGRCCLDARCGGRPCR